MQSKNAEYLIEAAKSHADPIAAIVQKATEVGVVVPSILRRELEAAGFKINEDEEEHKTKYGYRKFENLYRVLVHDKAGNIIAMGASDSSASALSHAILGYIRERDIEKVGMVIPLEVHRLKEPMRLATITDPKTNQPVGAEVVAAVKEHLSKKAKVG